MIDFKQIQKDVELAFPGKKVVYNSKFSPTILNGIHTINYEKFAILSMFNERDDIVYWNESNQSDLVFYEEELKKISHKLFTAKSKSNIFKSLILKKMR